MTAKTSSRVAVVVRRIAAVERDQAGVDPWRRPEHLAADGAGHPHLAVPGRLDRREPYAIVARLGREPLGDLELHHHQHPPHLRQPRQQREQHRDGHVVRQVGDDRGRAASCAEQARCRVVIASRCMTVELRPRVRRNRSRDGVGERPASRPSISTATTCRTAGSNASVSEPRPGPISSTTSSAPTLAVRTMRCTVPPSMTKFWPRVFVGVRPIDAASARTSAAPSSCAQENR